MKNDDIILKDFVGIFPNAASKEYCEKVIHRYEYMKECGNVGRGIVSNRQDHENAKSIFKENDTYNLGGTAGDHWPLEDEDKRLMERDMPLLREFHDIIWNCYDIYTQKYTHLTSLPEHKIGTGVRIQKYHPGQGYHIWHCDNDDANTTRRVLTIALYLNTVEDGGETELLYQSMRIPPVQGTVTLCPPMWTHLHRGNPPLKVDKYFMTTWLEFQSGS